MNTSYNIEQNEQTEADDEYNTYVDNWYLGLASR
jgi:hypothetical protein